MTQDNGQPTIPNPGNDALERVLPIDHGVILVDDGCAHSPSCLECPLPVCIHDVNWGARALKNPEGQRKRTRILELLGRGVLPQEIAQEVGMSDRNVYRIQAKLREAQDRINGNNRNG